MTIRLLVPASGYEPGLYSAENETQIRAKIPNPVGAFSGLVYWIEVSTDEPDAPDGRPRVAPAPKPRVNLPVDGAARKEIPLARGLLDYFPAALAAVAALSKKGNDQHNPGEEMHHARGKSGDHADCIMRHLVDRGTVDTDGIRHSAKVAWRALALLQQELEDAEGAPLPRGAKL